MNQTTTCSLSTLSETLQITSRRVQQLAKEGVVHKSGRGKYQYLKSVMGYIAYLSRLVPGKSIADTGETMGDIKAEQCKGTLCKAKRCKAKQCEANQCKAKRCNAKQCRANLCKARRCKAKQCKANQCKAKRYNAKQRKPKQSKAMRS